FQNAVLVSGDGMNWTEQTAPWTTRCGVATCVYDGKLFMTGGKYSVTENGNIRFIYSNDVWYMTSSKKFLRLTLWSQASLGVLRSTAFGSRIIAGHTARRTYP